MGVTYSLHAAKARFSEVIRQVREGVTVTVSYRGEPVAEIRPLAGARETLEERYEELKRKGIVVSANEGAERRFEPVAHRPGALARFLADRGE